jgi:hypothetical protein
MFRSRSGLFSDVAGLIASLSPSIGRVVREGGARADGVRRRVRTAQRAVRRAAGEARQQTEQALTALGVQSAGAAPVIDVEQVGADVGAVRALARRATQALVVLAATVVLGVALLSLGVFAGAAAFAFVLVTRGLGLRVDVPGFRPATVG